LKCQKLQKSSDILQSFKILQQFKTISTKHYRNLIKYRVHVGHESKETYQKLSPYIFGSRYKLHIINLKYTTTSLKLSTQFLLNVTSIRNRTLFVLGNRYDNFLKQFKNILNNMYKDVKNYILLQQLFVRILNVNYYADLWISGLISNFFRVRRNMKNTKKFLMSDHLPTVLVGLDLDNKNSFSIVETAIIKIPQIALIDTTARQYASVCYPIASSDDSLRTLVFFSNLFLKIIFKGHIVRNLKYKQLITEHFTIRKIINFCINMKKKRDYHTKWRKRKSKKNFKFKKFRLFKRNYKKKKLINWK